MPRKKSEEQEDITIASCKNCRFRYVPENPNGQGFLDEEDAECRRYPRTIILIENELIAMSPTAPDLFWCGEWQIRCDS